MKNMGKAGRALIGAMVLVGAGVPATARAHFQELIPSADIVEDGSANPITLEITFTHPFERGPTMNMAKPVRFGVVAQGNKRDLMASLQEIKVDGKSAYQARFDVDAPADYIFFLEPAPYWEPAEGKMIVHYTKVVVDGFGAEEGWDAQVGLPVEIEPLTRPYGVWSGNVFRGIVRADGKPVPFADIEVEWKNDGSLTAPAGAFVTQVVKADSLGVFTYAMPRAGWWGFAALVVDEAKKMKAPTGDMVPVERGGLIWVRAVDMK